jgi:ribonuclease Z
MDMWKEIIQLKPFDLTIRGFSQGGNKTGFYIPQLKLFLDAGIQSHFDPVNILITHSHSDHSFALPMLITGISTQPTIHVPIEHQQLFEHFVNATYQLTQGDSGVVSAYPIIGVKEHDIIRLTNHHYAEVFDLQHDVPCRGYGLYRLKSKLLPQFAHLSGTELSTLKRQNISITTEIRDNIVAYLTDTAPTIFDKYPQLFDYPYIMIECTFIHDTTITHDHTHWSQLQDYVRKYPSITFILIHFSRRYTSEEIIDFFKKQNLNNIIIVSESSIVPHLREPIVY